MFCFNHLFLNWKIYLLGSFKDEAYSVFIVYLGHMDWCSINVFEVMNVVLNVAQKLN